MQPSSSMTLNAANSDERPALAGEILSALTYRLGKDPTVATPYDWLAATIKVVRDRMIEQWIASTKKAYQEQQKRVYYLSLEFLIGRLFRDATSNLGLMDEVSEALASLGVDVAQIAALEPDAALGNGGLGRLAACFMESMATVDIPAHGYGIRYVHGLFRQEISDGWQVELPETWLEHGNPWEFERRERSIEIGFGGTVEMLDDDGGTPRYVWKPQERVLAVAYDTPVAGWRGKRVNTLRLWSAMPLDPILLDAFNAGDHIGALRESNKAESLARVLYPNDTTPAGQELRLRQEYFFSAASLQDIVHRHLVQYETLDTLPDKAAIQLNDTHPAISVAELLRLLIDVHGYAFDDAWDITSRTFAYTNHTLLPEALESWPVPLLERLLPRHMQLVYAINAKILRLARKERGFDGGEISRISLIDENGDRRVRMGNLAFMGSQKVNGVSALHTGLMKETVFADLHRLYPDKINNKTNGITPRRWLMQCNPGLTGLIADTIGDRFLDDIDALTDLEGHAADTAFQDAFAAVKRANKARLAELVAKRLGVRLDPSALFDIQIKRIHEYKRQLLNILDAIALYDDIRRNPDSARPKVIKMIAGKAAPSYWRAKLIIKLANDVGRVIREDEATRGRLELIFLANYNVSLAERMIPAADLSEQISTAGMEASGTGNMKLALNGAVTIGTLDGANVEMLEHVGEEGMIIFGLDAAEAMTYRQSGRTPGEAIDASPSLSRALELLENGHFSRDDPGRFRPVVEDLRRYDHFLVTADFQSYRDAQARAHALFTDSSAWWKAAACNTARMGWFSSDRTIRGYADDIWQVRHRG